MTDFLTKIEIDTDTSKVWNALANSKLYPAWNPLIYRLEGEFRVGSKPKFFVNMPYGIRASFRATILKAEPSRELRWFGKLLETEFLLAGEHFFILESTRKGTTRLIHGEKLSGLISPAFLRVLGPKIQQSYIEFNTAIKRYCERIN